MCKMAPVEAKQKGHIKTAKIGKLTVLWKDTDTDGKSAELCWMMINQGMGDLEGAASARCRPLFDLPRHPQTQRSSGCRPPSVVATPRISWGDSNWVFKRGCDCKDVRRNANACSSSNSALQCGGWGCPTWFLVETGGRSWSRWGGAWREWSWKVGSFN